MSEFDRRKQGFEKFFELSEALRFKALSRRNRAVGALGGGEARARGRSGASATPKTSARCRSKARPTRR